MRFAVLAAGLATACYSSNGIGGPPPCGQDGLAVFVPTDVARDVAAAELDGPGCKGAVAVCVSRPMDPCTLYGSDFQEQSRHTGEGKCAITVSFKSGRPAFAATVEFKVQTPGCDSYPVPSAIHVPSVDADASMRRGGVDQ